MPSSEVGAVAGTVHRGLAVPPVVTGPRRLVLLARPGAGKSTQAERLAARLGVVHLATGDVLRREVASATPLGRAVAEALEHGELAPDELVMSAIVPDLEEALTRGGGFVLDGFPRDLPQARALAGLSARGLEPQLALEIDVSVAECRRRLLARAPLEGRSDDNAETIDHRLASYEAEMAPVIDFYRDEGILRVVDGERAPDEVTKLLLGELGLD